MTKQQKEVVQLKREIRKLERNNRSLEEQLKRAENGSRYWQREYNRLLEDLKHNLKPRITANVNPNNPDPINRV